MGGGLKGRISTEEHLLDFTRCCVRAGLLSDEQLRQEVAEAIVSELPAGRHSVEELARSWAGRARDELAREQDGWPEVTDYDRLQTAFAGLETRGVVVLQGVEDHWSAKAELERRDSAGRPPRGVAWFTAADVWHAVGEGMLEVNLWHGTTANVAPGDALLDDALAIFGEQGLAAHFDEGRIELAARWQRRIALPVEHPLPPSRTSVGGSG